MSRPTRCTLLAGTAALVTTALAPCALPAQTPTAAIPLRVGFIPSDFAAQALYADQLGLFAKAGFAPALTPLTSGPAIAAAVLSGSLDAGYSNLLSLAIAHDKGIPVSVLAGANMYVADAPTVGLIGVKRDGPITNAKDFTGQTMAVGALNNITHIGARAWLDAHGGDSAAVKFVEIPISEMAPAVLSGRVAGAVMDPGVYPTLGRSDDPIRVLAHAFDAIAREFLSGGWFASNDWIAKNAGPARRFADAMNAAGSWGNAHHRESAPIVATYLKESVGAVEASTRVVYGTTLTRGQMQPSISVAAKYGVISRDFPARDLVASIIGLR